MAVAGSVDVCSVTGLVCVQAAVAGRPLCSVPARAADLCSSSGAGPALSALSRPRSDPRRITRSLPAAASLTVRYVTHFLVMREKLFFIYLIVSEI